MPEQRDISFNLFSLLSYKIGTSSHLYSNLSVLYILGQKGTSWMWFNDYICVFINVSVVRATGCRSVTDL